MAKDAARPGPWRHEMAPYLSEILDATDDPDVDVIVVQKSARVGGSELCNIAQSSWVDQSPGPILLVYPTEASAKERVENEIRPLFEKIPRLARHLPGGRWGLTQGELDLVPCRIYVGWAGSPQALASRTIRRIVLDEVNKFPRFSGTDASPIALALRRLETYGRRATAIITSTPTTRTGAITQELSRCVDVRHWEMPCPRCGARTRIGADMLRWPGRGTDQRDAKFRADEVSTRQSAWMECPACHGEIREADKAAMVRAGQWVSDGYPPGEHPRSRRRGYQISALHSLLGRSWSDVAAQWILAEGDTALEYELWTQVFGIPFDRERNSVDVVALESRGRAKHRQREAPLWASVLLLTADTQKDHYYWVLRAWSADYGRSRQIDRGVARSLAELEQIEGGAYPVAGRDDLLLRVALTGIDSGGGVEVDDQTTTTERVYAWCRGSPRRRLPLKGWGGSKRPERPISVREIEYQGATAGRLHWGVKLHLVDTHHYKDKLADLVGGPAERWEVAYIDAEYTDHMTAETKVTVMSKGGKPETRWEPLTKGRRHDQRDCEVYQLALADVARAMGVRSVGGSGEREPRYAPAAQDKDAEPWRIGR